MEVFDLDSSDVDEVFLSENDDDFIEFAVPQSKEGIRQRLDRLLERKRLRESLADLEDFD